MKLSDILYSLLIISFFMGCILFSMFTGGMEYINNNWEIYKCNPAIMPFAGSFGRDVMANTLECITEIQTGITAGFMGPFTTLVASMGGVADGVSDQMTKQSIMMQTLSKIASGKFVNLFSSFFNVLMVFHKFIIDFKDIQMKILGVVTTIIYMITGQNLLGESLMKGPVMKILTTVGKGADMLGM